MRIQVVYLFGYWAYNGCRIVVPPELDAARQITGSALFVVEGLIEDGQLHLEQILHHEPLKAAAWTKNLWNQVREKSFLNTLLARGAGTPIQRLGDGSEASLSPPGDEAAS